jgi:hypothetical protein
MIWDHGWQAPAMTLYGAHETDPDLDPIYDAVGRAIEAATAVESFLNLVASMVADLTYDRQPWSKVSAQVRTAVRIRLLPEHQPLVEQVLSEGERLLDIRNGLVHGAWLWGETPNGVLGFETQRPPRSKNPEMITNPRGEEVPLWVKQTFTRGRLLTFSNDCQAVAATIQSQIAAWTEHLESDG